MQSTQLTRMPIVLRFVLALLTTGGLQLQRQAKTLEEDTHWHLMEI